MTAATTKDEIEKRYFDHVGRCTTCSTFLGRIFYKGCRTGRILLDAYYGAYLVALGQPPSRMAWMKKGTSWRPGVQSVDPAALLALIDRGRKAKDKVEL